MSLQIDINQQGKTTGKPWFLKVEYKGISQKK
jgi:hypothetical protein